jgi:uncharacterized coiled-coil protein SlyX
VSIWSDQQIKTLNVRVANLELKLDQLLERLKILEERRTLSLNAPASKAPEGRRAPG